MKNHLLRMQIKIMIDKKKRRIIRKMASLQGVAIFLFIFLAAGCGRVDNVVYSEFADFGSEGWDPVECLEFHPWPSDSIVERGAGYDVVVCVRYSGKCQLKQLPLQIESMSLRQAAPDTLRLAVPLYGDDGRRRGKGPYTVFEVSDTIARSVPLPTGYTLTLFNPLSAQATRGITNLGIILSRSN